MKDVKRSGKRQVTVTGPNGGKINKEVEYSVTAPEYSTLGELMDDASKLQGDALASFLGMVQLAIFGKYESLAARKTAQGEPVEKWTLEDVFSMSSNRFSYKGAIEAQQERLQEVLLEIAKLAQSFASGSIDPVAFAAELSNLSTEQKQIQATIDDLEEKLRAQNEARAKSKAEKGVNK